MKAALRVYPLFCASTGASTGTATRKHLAAQTDALRHGCKEAFPSGYSPFSVVNSALVGSAIGVRIESPLQRLRPPLPPKLNSAPGLGAVRFVDSFLTNVVSKQRGARQARVRCRSGFLTRGCAPQNGRTPLHAAAYQGHDAVVRVLVEVGADVTAKDKVSERRVGGDGHMLSKRRDFSEWGQPSGEPQSPAWNARLLAVADRCDLQTKRTPM